MIISTIVGIVVLLVALCALVFLTGIVYRTLPVSWAYALVENVSSESIVVDVGTGRDSTGGITSFPTISGHRIQTSMSGDVCIYLHQAIFPYYYATGWDTVSIPRDQNVRSVYVCDAQGERKLVWDQQNGTSAWATKATQPPNPQR